MPRASIGGLANAWKKARSSKKRKQPPPQGDSEGPTESAVRTGRSTRTSRSAAEPLPEPTPPPPVLEHDMVVHCIAVLPGQATRPRKGSKAAEGLPDLDPTFVTFESDFSLYQLQREIARQVEQQSGVEIAPLDVRATFQVAGSALFKQPLVVNDNRQYAKLLEALASKPGKPLEVYINVEVAPVPDPVPTSAAEDAPTQNPVSSQAPQEPSAATAKQSYLKAKRNQAIKDLEKDRALLDRTEPIYEKIEDLVPVCQACRNHRNGDVRCFISGEGVHHPLDHKLVLDWATEVAMDEGTLDRPSDKILIASLDRVAAVRGIHAARSPGGPLGSPAFSRVGAQPTTPAVATTVGAAVRHGHEGVTAVTPSPTSRLPLGQITSNQVAAESPAPAAAEPVTGKRGSVWRFVKWLDQGDDDLAIKLTRADVRTMQILAKAHAQNAYGRLQLTDLERILIDEWLVEWRMKKWEGESGTETASSIREALSLHASHSPQPAPTAPISPLFPAYESQEVFD